MNVHELQHGKISTIELAPALGADFGIEIAAPVEARLFGSEMTGDYSLEAGNFAGPVRGIDSRHSSRLSMLLDRNLHRICWIAGAYHKGNHPTRVVVQIHEFASYHHWPDTIDLAIDEKILEELRLKRRELQGIDSILRWLSQKLLLQSASSKVRALISAAPTQSAETMTAFRIYGRGVAADVARTPDSRLRVTRIVEVRRPQGGDELRPIMVVEGAFKFVDATIAGEFRGTARSILDEMVEKSTGYLQLWKEYNQLERKGIVSRARDFGWLSFKSRNQVAGGAWRFSVLAGDRVKIQAAFQYLRDNEKVTLEVGDVVPSELRRDVPETSTRGSRPFYGKCIAADPNHGYIVIEPETELDDVEPLASGFLFVSLTGDRKRLSRRQVAQSLIASATCPMPQLGLLIEGLSVPERRHRTEKATSPGVREVFGSTPTARQVEALKVALNTPDIALIQGPPGTGKTLTIAALQVRLAEILEDREMIAGQTLLTSYQHNAVENVASKTVVFGLPAIKVDRKRGGNAETDGFDRWRRERISSVRSQLAHINGYPANQVLRNIRQLAIGYLRAPTPKSDAVALLQTVAQVTKGFLSPNVNDRLEEVRNQLTAPSSGLIEDAMADQLLLMTAVRGLRTDAVSFSDDGPQSAMKLLIRLQRTNKVDQQDESLLVKASRWESEDTPDFVDDLSLLQAKWLDWLSPDERPPGSPMVNAEVERVLNEVVEDLYLRARNSGAGAEAVLYDYLDDLENGPSEVRDTVREYSAVLAATCQHSVGYEMNLIKDTDSVFDTVIVDEAARANPLDLLIPLSRAERRIVLVGDHRQLPHILEPDVERELDKSVREETREALKRSLFERLFRDLRERETSDGIKRTVTLDLQFRMHPALAQFVSDVFYKPYGEEFGSDPSTNEFTHALSEYDGAVAAWINIPLSRGSESGGRSKKRPVEARWIAKEARRLMEERPDFSVGVISFYAAQVDELLREFAEEGITAREENGSFAVSQAWTETVGKDGGLKERLRVGTVDAFQGKEFDLVILSMTRSNQLRSEDELQRRKKYGHLMLENRLCVAMSRQQRLLIVVGDEAMLQSDDAISAIPALVEFHRFCGGPSGRRISA